MKQTPEAKERERVCGYIPPRGIPFNHSPKGECLLSAGHSGLHVSGGYVWQYDDECDCCDVADSDRCFSFRERGAHLNPGQEG